MENTDLNKLEYSIIENFAKEYPIIKDHVCLLKVESREDTGGGMYVNFAYKYLDDDLVKLEDGTLSTNEIIVLDSLKNGLGFVLDISHGLINFIEMFTYGDDLWNGNFNEFRFEKT